MPKVPVYEQSVEPAPAPSPRINPNVSSTALGGGAGEGLQNVASGMNQIGQIRERARQDANNLTVASKDQVGGEWENTAVHDPQNGALTKRGEDAFPAMQQVLEGYDKFTGEQLDDIHDSDAKERVRQAFAQRRLGIERTLQQHVGREIEQHKEDVFSASMTTSHNASVANYDDPVRLQVELDRQSKLIELYADGKGWDQTQIDEAKLKASSATHEGVIDRFLADRNSRAARDYFVANKDAIEPDERVKLQAHIDKTDLANESATRADRIYETNDTMAEMRTDLRKIDDPELRKATEQRVFELRSLEEQASQQDRSRRFNAVQAYMREASTDAANHGGKWDGRVEGPAYNAYLELEPSDQTKLDAIRSNMINGADVETDLSVYSELSHTMTERPEEFKKINIDAEYANTLSREDRKKFIDFQTGLRGGKDKTADEIKGIRSQQEIVDGTLKQLYGSDLTPKNQTKTNEIELFRRSVDDQVEAWKREYGKTNIPSAEVQKIVDHQAMEHAFKRYRLGLDYLKGDVVKPTFKLTLDDITIDDVPADRKNAITQQLILLNQAPTPENIRRLYLNEVQEAP